MRTYLPVIITLLLISLQLNAQLEKAYVEKYYISDSNDTLDTFGSRLENGSITYRVYLDLEDGYALKSIFGTKEYPLEFKSSDPFFNHSQYGKQFAHLISSGFLRIGNMALDSWLTIGYATNKHLGVLKTEDSDSSIVGGLNNIDGMLTNDDPEAGISIVMADGLTETNVAQGFNIQEDSESVFGTGTSDSVFLFTNSDLTYSVGRNKFDVTNQIINHTKGMNTEYGNVVLVAQLTTKGKLSFKLNVEIVDTATNDIFIYHGKDSVITGSNQNYSTWLSYPYASGCTNPYFVEYNPDAVADDGSCTDSIVLGCSDPNACNYDPNVDERWGIPQLCCYGPDNCDDRDISIVCPNYKQGEIMNIAAKTTEFQLYPNPAQNELIIRPIQFNTEVNELRYKVYNSFGSMVMEGNFGNLKYVVDEKLDISSLKTGMYFIRLFDGVIDSNPLSFIKIDPE